LSVLLQSAKVKTAITIVARDHAMTNDSTKSSISQPASDTTVCFFDDWFDPIEAGVRDRVRGFIEAMIEGELDSALLRPRYGRDQAAR
jgi:hypothetical protein